MTGQGEPHSRRMFAPGVTVLAGFVLLVGNPWLNLEIARVTVGADSIFRLVGVVVAYPVWHVDVDRAGPFLFWFANLRTALFVLLAVMGLSRVRRWVAETAGGAGLFVTTVGLTTLSAVSAGLLSALVTVALFDARTTASYVGDSEEFFLTQLGSSALFGVLFGSVLGAVVAAQRRRPVRRERPANAPKSLW
ncbi:hypothetical protein GCM10011609_24070 [Lentzea pudingi]|uniref:Uncharacterized protein n=2 Tax=Lentzea pudingi TaxID=1789439 RepID=A0ABQ2HPY6_9PSEU|nr:hypothetical protein GCM10011609_24070 [Lentzea pudingi]